MARWAARKGIALLGTGDFTHPAWLRELESGLVEAEPGLFRLKPELERELPQETVGDRGSFGVRFVLQVEISTIYKYEGRTRKVHHLIYVPGFDEARRLRERLGRIGNVDSDGRPILGLDSRELLEIVLECGEDCYLIPAHIWTPWFSVLGSKSGFESIEACYRDLADRIFAVETGLSSDPPMNWRLASLDKFRLVSNSDAHSPAKLGRECCLFDTELNYYSIRDSLRSGKGYLGTVEFFPEEGKYHYDGHRNCNVCLTPEETRRLGGICPVCGKPLTVGVLYRVEELADRPPGRRPPEADGFWSLVPLPEILAEIHGVGPATKTVRHSYEMLLRRLGPELHVLAELDVAEIRRAGSELLAEAVARLRRGEVIRSAGYDGRYGSVRLFRKGELSREHVHGVLFDLPPTAPPPEGKKMAAGGDEEEYAFVRRSGRAAVNENSPVSAEVGLDPEQQAAVRHGSGPLMIVAGPGTGKTHTLTQRIAYLVREKGVPAEECLAITFTRRAAAEMTSRLKAMGAALMERVTITTFHGLGRMIMREYAGVLEGVPGTARVVTNEELLEIVRKELGFSKRKAGEFLRDVEEYHRRGESGGELPACVRDYDRIVTRERVMGFSDLIYRPVKLLEENADVRRNLQKRFGWIAVDEFQDVDPLQYRLIRLLAPPDGNICVIGDPDQSIYGFRGAQVSLFMQFTQDYPGTHVVHLRRNYRSSGSIVRAALQAMAPQTLVPRRVLEALPGEGERVTIHTAATDKAEAEYVVHTIERMIGGATFFSMDSGRVAAGEGLDLSFGDFAVLYRTDAQAEALVEAFARSGMPYHRYTHGTRASSPLMKRLLDVLAADGRPPGVSLAARLEQAASELEQSDGDNREAVRETLAASKALAADCGDNEDEFLSELAMGMEVDALDPRADRVALLTLHAAKGMEFAVVFITGCEDGLLPLRWGGGDGAGGSESAEERRLFFVGMTRARRRLFLVHARRRQWQGRVRSMAPSPFLADIRNELLRRERAGDTHRSRRRIEVQLDLDLG